MQTISAERKNLDWIRGHRSSFKEVAISLDAALWLETETVSADLERYALTVLENVTHKEYQLITGGVYPLLYFMTRYMAPNYIVETGVSAGFSSYAFLSAMKVNGKGTLYSSDLPYFRVPNAESYIGIVVEESLRDNWELYLQGDRKNLPKIVDSIRQIDIFHYDSDKSYAGREFSITMIEKKMSPHGIIVIDDIQDNVHFYDYIEQHTPDAWSIFEFQGKYIGMVGKLARDSF